MKDIYEIYIRGRHGSHLRYQVINTNTDTYIQWRPCQQEAMCKGKTRDSKGIRAGSVLARIGQEMRFKEKNKGWSCNFSISLYMTCLHFPMLMLNYWIKTLLQLILNLVFIITPKRTLINGSLPYFPFTWPNKRMSLFFSTRICGWESLGSVHESWV